MDATLPGFAQQVDFALLGILDAFVNYIENYQQLADDQVGETMKSKRLALCAAASLAMTGFATADGLSHLPLVSEVAPDAQAISPHVPHMGVHWANPADLPNGGPIFCEIDGRVVCVEYIFPAEAIQSGTDFKGLLPGMETPPITHIDWDYIPDGVGGDPTPVYQLHIYFVGQDVLASH